MGGTPNRRRQLLAHALAAGLGLAVEHAIVLLVLIDHYGQELTSEEMQYLCNPHSRLALNVFQERIRKIRSVMGRAAIAGFKTAAERITTGLGRPSLGASTYSLSPLGMELCQDALRRIVDELPTMIGEPKSRPMRTSARVRPLMLET